MKVMATLFLLLLPACYQQAREYSLERSSSGGEPLAPHYGLVAPQAIIDNMTNSAALGLPATNESVVDIKNRRVELGDADPVNKILRNTKASAGKFKTIFENYVNACADGLGISTTPSAAQQAARTRLFPKGASLTEASFDTLFLAYLGRLPSSEERAALLQLVQGVSDQVKFAAACAGVLASMEALNGT